MAGQHAALPGEKESSSSSPFVAAARRVRSLYPQEAKRPQKKEKAFSPPSAETRRPLTTTLLRIECSSYPRRSRSVTDTACARLLGGLPEHWPRRVHLSSLS